MLAFLSLLVLASGELSMALLHFVQCGGCADARAGLDRRMAVEIHAGKQAMHARKPAGTRKTAGLHKSGRGDGAAPAGGGCIGRIGPARIVVTQAEHVMADGVFTGCGVELLHGSLDAHGLVDFGHSFIGDAAIG